MRARATLLGIVIAGVCAASAPGAGPRVALSRAGYWRCWYRRGGDRTRKAS